MAWNWILNKLPLLLFTCHYCVIYSSSSLSSYTLSYSRFRFITRRVFNQLLLSTCTVVDLSTLIVLCNYVRTHVSRGASPKPIFFFLSPLPFFARLSYSFLSGRIEKGRGLGHPDSWYMARISQFIYSTGDFLSWAPTCDPAFQGGNAANGGESRVRRTSAELAPIRQEEDE
jgi:hypothetical protein